jgi:hypothetical protein
MLDSRVEMQPKILVIGSKDHDRADCVDWLQPFPNIEEYDYVVINLKSLTQDVYRKIPTKIRGMRESVTTVFKTDREIFCIIDKLIHATVGAFPASIESVYTGKGVIKSGYVPPTNYDWLPVKIKVSEQKKGTSINLHNHRFDWYFEYVDKWNFEIATSETTRQDSFRWLSHTILPIATNKSKKTIAGSLKHQNMFTGEITGEGAIHLLPPPTKCDTHRSIEIILDITLGSERKIVPPWRKKIEVPKIREFEQAIESKIQDIGAIQQEISQLRNQMQEWDSYRDLLTVSGYALENIVHKALSDIGIKTRKTEKGFPTDLISNKVAVEITGIKGCVGVSSEKVIQTGRFKEVYHKKEKIILIANTYMNLPPQKRKGRISFSPEVNKYFKSIGVCCLTTQTLFQLWKDVLTGKKSSKDVRKKILTKNGELTLSEFE